MKYLLNLLVLTILFSCSSQKEVAKNSTKETPKEESNRSVVYTKRNPEGVQQYYIKPDYFHKTIKLYSGYGSDKKEIGLVTSTTSVELVKMHELPVTDGSSMYNVWNEVKIDGRTYFTNHELHDYVISRKMDKLNQSIEVIGKKSNDDPGYHYAYPENFFVLVRDAKGNIIYDSEILDYEMQNEFAVEEEIFKMNFDESQKAYKILLGWMDNRVEIIWNGKDFSYEMVY